MGPKATLSGAGIRGGFPCTRTDDRIYEAGEPGKWLLHCHIPHHATNDDEEGGGGLTMVMNVTE